MMFTKLILILYTFLQTQKVDFLRTAGITQAQLQDQLQASTILKLFKILVFTENV